MAKDVDLSSNEWTEIIFDGRNKDFGAYVMRKKSDSRHNRAVLYTFIGLAVVVVGGLAWSLYAQHKAELAAEEERMRLAALEQQMMAEAQLQEDQEEEEEVVIYEEPEEIEEEEEIEELAANQYTDFTVTENEKDTEKALDITDLSENENQTGTVTNEDGKNMEDLGAKEMKEDVKVEAPKPVAVKEEIFTAVEQPPTFPGGEQQLYKFIADNLRYPTVAQENGIEGRVIVQFVVQKDGSIGQVKIAKSVDPDLDKEAMRVVKKLPKFVPGKMNGQAVNVWYTLPVRFKLAQ